MPIVRFQTVSKYFTPESYALQEVSFDIDPGELIFVTGPSGSGKTTLMRLMTCEYSPTEGEIFFNDSPLSIIRPHTVHQHRRKIGVVFQDYRLISEMNVWENIALPLYVTGTKESDIEQRVTDLLNLIKLPDKAESFPSQLSGGEAQRVSIARALASAPEVIFADEPTGNLDPETSKSIAALLRKINELGTTVFVATHDWEILNNHGDVRQLHLERGKITKDSKVGKKPAFPKSEAKNQSAESEESKQTASDDDLTPKTATETILETTPQDTPVKSSSTSWWKRWFSKTQLDSAEPSDDASDHDLAGSDSATEETPQKSKSQSSSITDDEDNSDSKSEKSQTTTKNTQKKPAQQATEKTTTKADEKSDDSSKQKSAAKKSSATSTKKK
ncbi:MAG: ATP-binding cassette domain-containing protein [Patescibacteria group bacterium]